jgi:hypothetical protein
MIVVTIYQNLQYIGKPIVTVAQLHTDAEPLTEHAFEDADIWHALRITLDDVAPVAVRDAVAVFANVPIDLHAMPEHPPNEDKYWIPEKGGRGKYIRGRWGGNADYWQTLHRLNEYKRYKINQVDESQIPGTVQRWQKQFNP